jgi:hypothetical protein
MRTIRSVMILVLSTWLWTGPILGRNGTDEGRELKRIYFSALKKDEKPALGLKASDFQLKINGKIAALENFHAALPPTDRSIPLAAWILISFGGPNIKAPAVEKQANAAAAAFEKLHPDSVMGIKLVSDRSETMAPLAHDPKALRGAFLQYSQRRTELRVGLNNGSVPLGEWGMARAVDLAIDELDTFVSSDPRLENREVHRAIMIISAGDINPYYNMKSLYAKAARQRVFLYPVFVPVSRYGQWVLDFFELAKKTAGVAAVEGALRPGAGVLPLPRNNQNENALDVNFFHLVRDVNGKYSFTIPASYSDQALHLDLKCKIKDVTIRLPLASLP